MTRPARRIDVHIERVSLRGTALDAGQRDQLLQALEAELAARLEADPVAPAGHARLRGTPTENTPVSWSPGDDPARLGRDVGRAVHRRLRP